MRFVFVECVDGTSVVLHCLTTHVIHGSIERLELFCQCYSVLFDWVVIAGLLLLVFVVEFVLFPLVTSVFSSRIREHSSRVHLRELVHLPIYWFIHCGSMKGCIAHL